QTMSRPGLSVLRSSLSVPSRWAAGDAFYLAHPAPRCRVSVIFLTGNIPDRLARAGGTAGGADSGVAVAGSWDTSAGRGVATPTRAARACESRPVGAAVAD